MKLRFLIATIFVVLFAGVVAACGSSTDTTSSTQAVNNADVPDPCGAFTKTDAEAVLGEPVNEAERSDADNTKSCSYMTKGAAPRIANVIIVKPCSMADYSNLATNPAAEPVEGIGMHASWDKSVLLVHAASGDTCVYATGGGNPPGTDPASDKPALEQAKKVANIVLAKLDSGSGSSTGGM
ncbi:MAG: hypothetical protein M1539_02535 [Actinobacteria bacterium]|nr:hypothetical protein [Actinomycetota bacterium]MCL5882843.1 hypothetical protein [Actinomycetota bacterium]